jgi:hypothetical protein
LANGVKQAWSIKNYRYVGDVSVLAIVGDNSEEFDKNNNPVLNPANIDR